MPCIEEVGDPGRMFEIIERELGKEECFWARKPEAWVPAQQKKHKITYCSIPGEHAR